MASLFLIAILSIVNTKRMVKRCQINFSSKNLTCLADDVISIHLGLNQLHFFDCHRVKYRILVKHHLYRHTTEYKKEILLKPREKGKIVIPYVATKSDYLEISLLDFWMKDITNTFSFHKKCNQSCSVLVMPHVVTKMDADRIEKLMKNPQDQIGYEQVRDYRIGDKLSRIHWKLYASKNHLFVKEGDEEDVLYDVVFELPEKEENYQQYLDQFYAETYPMFCEGKLQSIQYEGESYEIKDEVAYMKFYQNVFMK